MSRYLDLGTGIGSSLLLVANNARPQQYSIGVEAQEISVQCLRRTLLEIPDRIDIRALHRDLRDLTLEDFQGLKFDVITANPPFAPPSSGTLCADEQRRYARFELRGGVEEYCACASRLLNDDGRFVLAFWVKQDGRRRVEEAAKSAELVVTRRIDVVAGAPTNDKPHLHIFEIKRGGEADLGCDEFELDIRRDSLSGGLSQTYLSIMRELRMQARPLKV
jgi:tRNA1(Val) A37 N6-methylase TrmN6